MGELVAVSGGRSTAPVIDLGELEDRFLEMMDVHYPVIPLPALNRVQRKALARIADVTGTDALALIEAAIREWFDLSAWLYAGSTDEHRMEYPSVVAMATRMQSVIAWAECRNLLPSAPRKSFRVRDMPRVHTRYEDVVIAEQQFDQPVQK